MIAIKNCYLRLVNSKRVSFYLMPLLLFLQLLSFLYFVIIKCLCYFRMRRKINFKIPIISVGNITWGGSGKTPLVIEIARYLKDKNIKVSIVHHGRYYRDECLLLKENLKDVLIICGKSKLQAIKKIARDKLAQVVILDDGYQQWRLKKELEILCLNYNAIFGNGYLIPRGNLREVPKSLNRADLILLNKAWDLSRKEQIIKEIKNFNTKAEIIITKFRIAKIIDLKTGLEREYESLKEIPSALLTAVADPLSVVEVLADFGLKVKKRFIYPDHYNFSYQDLLCVKKKLTDIRTLFITEKDYVKIKNIVAQRFEFLNGLDILLLKLKFEFLENEKALYRRLNLLLANSFI